MTHPAPDFALIIVAGGTGSRLAQPQKKAFVELAGAPLLQHTLRAFSNLPGLAETVIVMPGEELKVHTGHDTRAETARLPKHATEFARALGGLGATRFVVGGRRRQDSVLNGLWATSELPFVMVHDAARPFVTQDELLRLMAATRKHGAAILAHPMRDTIKRVKDGAITETVSRADLWAAQTPQAFRREVLLRALQKHNAVDLTDDAAAVALDGTSCQVVAGSAGNFKLTTPEDIEIAESLLALRAARNGDVRPASAVFRKIGSQTIFDVQPPSH